MEREIKFRVWDGSNMITESKRKEYDDYYTLDLDGTFYPHARHCDENYIPKDDCNKQYTIMQYTGLKDKNGVEIYEGYILNRLSENSGGMKVVFEEGSFTCYHKFGRWGLLSRCFDADIVNLGYQCEVIGNIHQNPELI